MQWLYKHLKICSVATSVLLLILGIRSFIRTPSYEFETVYQLLCTDGCFYGIDLNSYRINAFRMKNDGTELSCKELPVYGGSDTCVFYGKHLQRTDAGWTFAEENPDRIINTRNNEFTECRTSNDSGIHYGIYVTEKGKQVPAVYSESTEKEEDTVLLLQKGDYNLFERITHALKPYAIAFLLLAVLFLFIYFAGRREAGISLISEFIILLYPFAVVMIVIMFTFVHNLCFSSAENTSQVNLLTDARIAAYLLQNDDPEDLSLRYDGQEIYLLGETGEDLWRNHADSKKIKSAQKAVQENQPVLIRYAGDGVVYDSVFMAVADADGTAERIMEKRTNIFPNMVKVKKKADSTFYLISAVICGIFICMALILLIACRRMTTASQAVMKAGDGDIREVQPMHGISEVPALVRNVNHLLSRLSAYMTDFDRLNEKYQAFIPQTELEILGEDRTSDEIQTREKDIHAASASYYDPDLKKRYTDPELEKALEMMKENGFVIHHLGRNGFYGFSCDGCSRLLDSTVKLLENSSFSDGCAALTEGSVHIGMAGGGNRASVFLVSPDKVLSDSLSVRGQNIGCSLIITENFKEKAGNRIESYHVRELGDVFNRNDGSVTALYEVLDAQSSELRRRKEQTRTLFEHGVRFFRNEQALKARRCFVQVMEQNPSDKAAMHYIILCDDQIRNPEKATGSRHIFEYGSWE